MRLLIIGLTCLTAAIDTAGAQRLRVQGTVHESSGFPVADALVEISRDSGGAALLTTHTGVDGHFAFRNLTRARSLWIRTRRIGFVAGSRQLHPGADSLIDVDLRMGDWRAFRALADSARWEQRRRDVAAARTRPRHWTCAMPENMASIDRGFLYSVLVRDSTSLPEVERHRLPADSARFIRSFHAVKSKTACRRLAEGIDRDTGLVEDRISALRIGDLYFLPESRGGGSVVTPDGKAIGGFSIAY